MQHVRLADTESCDAGGATSAICKAAAQQVANTARAHPQQMPPILQKVPFHDWSSP